MNLAKLGDIFNGEAYSLKGIKENAEKSLAEKYAVEKGMELGSSNPIGAGNYDEYTKEINEYFEKTDTKKIDRWLAADNECTDEKDDGKISFWSKAGNIAEGFLKTFVGGAKEILSDPKKLGLLLVGAAATAILAATPAGAIAVSIIAITGGAKLIFDGTKKIIENVKYANEATTDAEAKDRWEDVGNGTAKVAVGTISIFGGIKGLKGINKKGAEEVALENIEKLQTENGWGDIVKETLLDPGTYVED